jgi:hypothetical protein
MATHTPSTDSSERREERRDNRDLHLILQSKRIGPAQLKCYLWSSSLHDLMER